MIALCSHSSVCPNLQKPKWSCTDFLVLFSVSWQDTEVVRNDFSSWEIFQIYSFRSTLRNFIPHFFHSTNSWEREAWWKLYQIWEPSVSHFHWLQFFKDYGMSMSISLFLVCCFFFIIFITVLFIKFWELILCEQCHSTMLEFICVIFVYLPLLLFMRC